MAREKIVKTYACDFETTVYDGQEYTEVWSAAICELYTENVIVGHSIEDMFQYFFAQKCNIVAYFHNLKFDGTFIISWLLENGYKQSYLKVTTQDDGTVIKWGKKMFNNEFQYLISSKGQWYTIKIKKYDKIIEFRDSLKLFPFTLKQVGEAFKTKHRKLDMEYKGLRYAGCRISDEEMEYIKNDVLVLKEALEYMFDQGHKKLTIGSNCLEEYKNLLGGESYFKFFFPNLYEISIDSTTYTQETAGDYILKSYKGGWCYLVEEKANRVYHNGITADVNSLYPSMMHSESGNVYPYGEPTFWSGNFIPDEAIGDNRYYFIRIRTRFYVKDNYLPFIQIKGNFMYKPNECLRTSDYHNAKSGKYYKYYIDRNGKKNDTRVTLTMTMTDYKLFLEHYTVTDFEILSGCWFKAITGLFDDYINKYKEIKTNATGALRTLAKLFLNNLYGKFASTPDSSFKVIYLRGDQSIGYIDQDEADKKPGYIAVGSAVTSYARNFTIRSAQKNYHGKDKPGFIYADTDSIHCDLSPDQLIGIPVHPTNFCCWKLESSWNEAIYARQKTYIERIIAKDLKPCTPEYNIICAGMPDHCKNLLNESITRIKVLDKHTEEELAFVLVPRTIEDFKIGLKVPGKLMPKRIRGGTILVDDYFTMQ